MKKIFDCEKRGIDIISRMSETTITCPSCGHTFSLSDVQKHELDHMRADMEKKIEGEVKQKAHEWAKSEVEKARKEEQEKSQAQGVELENLRTRDEQAQREKLDFLKQTQELENLKKNQLLELEKAKIEERKKVEEESKKQAEEKSKFETDKMKLEFDKKEAELRKQLEMSQKSAEDLSRKLNQGSMQIQGEVQEDALKNLLATSFPIDIIDDVEKGIKGADIIQTVRNDFGHTVGIIAWESKNTKRWDDSWIAKIKEDRLRVNASVSIIISSVMPKGVEKFGLYDGVWVVEWPYVREIAMILRSQLIEIATLQNSLVGREERLESVFKYLTSSKFRDKMENIISAFQEMQEQIQKERAVFEVQWKKREGILAKVLSNTSGMYGDLGGILGNKLEKVEYLELESGDFLEKNS